MKRARNTRLATIAAATLGLAGLSSTIHAATYSWNGQAISPLWHESLFGTTNWAGNILPTSSSSTALVFANPGAQPAPIQNIGNPFLLNRLTFTGASFVLTGQPLHFKPNVAILPHIFAASNVNQVINQSIVFDDSLILAGNGAGTLVIGGSMTSNSAGSILKMDASTVTLTGGGSYKSIATTGGAVFFSGGTTILGAGLEATAIQVVDSSSVNIRSGAVVDCTSGSGSVYVDDDLSARLSVSGSGSHLRAGFSTMIGDVGNGELLVSDQGRLTSNGFVVAGGYFDGAGSISVLSGGKVTSADAVLGGFSGASGVATISGAGSTWTTGNLGLGGYNQNANGGVGSIIIDSGGRVDASFATTFFTPGSSLTVRDGLFTTETLNDHWGMGGSIKLSSSTGTASLVVRDGTFTGSIGDANTNPGSFIKADGGTLTLGGGTGDFVPNTFTGFVTTLGGTLVLDKAPGVQSISGNRLTAHETTVRLNAPEQIANGATVVLDEATLDLNNNNETIRNINADAHSVIRLGQGNLTLLSDVQSFAVGTITSDGGGITKSGSSTLSLANSVKIGGMLVEGGIVDMRSGEFRMGNSWPIGLGITQQSAVEVSNAARVTILGDAAAVVGSGRLTVRGTDSSFSAPQAIIAGVSLADTGPASILVDHGATLSAGDYLAAGFDTPGTLTVQNGGRATSKLGALGLLDNATGLALVTGAGSSWTIQESLVVGGESDGFMYVTGGGSVSVGDNTLFGRTNSTIHVSGGSFTTGALSDSSDARGVVLLSDPTGGVALTVGANNASGTYGGPIADGAGGPGSLRKIGSGTMTLSGINSITGSTTVSGGTLRIECYKSLGRGPVNIDSALVEFAPGIATARAHSLSITGTGKVDLNDNDLVVSNNGTNKAAVEKYVRFARNDGAWNGPHGITSSAAKTHPSHATTLGVLSGAEYVSVGNPSSFGNHSVSANDTLVKYTWYGDTDFNGIVNFDDYARIDNGFSTNKTGWLNGDFDYSGVVNFDDYSMIDLAFNTQGGTLLRALQFLDGGDRNTSDMTSPGLSMVLQHFNQFGESYGQSFLTAVPEPTTATLGAALGGLLLVHRRRSSR